MKKSKLEKKKKHHKNKVKFYSKLINELKDKENRIGFKWYDNESV